MKDWLGGKWVHEARIRLGGNRDAAKRLVGYGRQLVGHLRDLASHGGSAVQVIRKKLPDGSLVVARLINGQAVIEVFAISIGKLQEETKKFMFTIVPYIYDNGLNEVHGYGDPFSASTPYATKQKLDKTVRGTAIFGQGNEMLYPEYSAWVVQHNTGAGKYYDEKEFFSGPINTVFEGKVYSFHTEYFVDRYTKLLAGQKSQYYDRSIDRVVLFVDGRVCAIAHTFDLVGSDVAFVSGIGVLHGGLVFVLTRYRYDGTYTVSDTVYRSNRLPLDTEVLTQYDFTQIGVRTYVTTGIPSIVYGYYFSDSGSKAVATVEYTSGHKVVSTSSLGWELLHLSISGDAGSGYSCAFSQDQAGFSGVLNGDPSTTSAVPLAADYTGESLAVLWYEKTIYSNVYTFDTTYYVRVNGTDTEIANIISTRSITTQYGYTMCALNTVSSVNVTDEYDVKGAVPAAYDLRSMAIMLEYSELHSSGTYESHFTGDPCTTSAYADSFTINSSGSILYSIGAADTYGVTIVRAETGVGGADYIENLPVATSVGHSLPAHYTQAIFAPDSSCAAYHWIDRGVPGITVTTGADLLASSSDEHLVYVFTDKVYPMHKVSSFLQSATHTIAMGVAGVPSGWGE